jgi:Domain of unknown function (DUF4189)
MPSSKPLSFWWVRLLLLCSFALGSTTYAQPSYEEDMARQRAQERQIMEDGIRQGAEAAQQSEYQQSTPHRWVSNHIAVAWHPDVMDVWASWQQDSKQAAEADALGACTAYMGPGCTIASSGYNISIAVSQGPDGFLFVAWGETKAKAKKNSLDQCGRPNCINKHLFSVEAAWLPVDEFMHHYPPLHTYFPQPKEKYRYGLVGWPKSVVDPKWQGKAWLITGSDNFESAKNKMLTKCKQDTGSDCDVFMTSGNTHLIQYLNNSTGIASWAVDFSKAEAEKQMTKACKKAKEKCSILNSYDAITPRDLIIDSPIARVRGYLAIAWPKKNKADEKLVVSTGHDELSTAKATALKECQKVNQAECTLVDENLDDGTYTHLGLYLDEKKSLRWYFGFNEKAIEKTAASDCTGCKMAAMLDARKKKNLVKNLAL